MENKKKSELPSLSIGAGRGSYVLHKIGARYYWYRHFYDPQLYNKTKDRGYSVKSVRDDPPGHVGKGMQEIPSEDELQVLREAIAAHNWGDGPPLSEPEKCQMIREGAQAYRDIFNWLFENKKYRSALALAAKTYPEKIEKIKQMEAFL